MIEPPPGVTRLEKTQPCQHYRYGHMPHKALRNPDELAKYQCKNRGRWQVRGEVLCWQHMWSELASLPLRDALDQEYARDEYA